MFALVLISLLRLPPVDRPLVPMMPDIPMLGLSSLHANRGALVRRPGSGLWSTSRNDYGLKAQPRATSAT